MQLLEMLRGVGNTSHMRSMVEIGIDAHLTSFEAWEQSKVHNCMITVCEIKDNY